MNKPHVRPPQFTLRGIFLLVLAAAVLSAFVGPQVRDAQAWQRDGFLLVWAGALMSAAVVCVICTAMQMRLTAVAGPAVARLRQPLITRIALVALGAFLGVLLVRISLAAAANASRPDDRVFSFVIGAVVGFVTPVPWLAAAFDDCYPQLREQGFFEMYGFHRWNDVVKHEWRERPRLALEVELAHRIVSIPVLAEHRETIAAAFAERSPRRAEAASG